ncbi:STAS/SEC14 domain-containing protein [Thiorhodococcus mannitoliphagus]|uniref:STAS/SEC14 domain-containing protein n=1 Tax=Thiorhodococcus mannitoliphagus TaxID=329406 RepID=A0A6P1DWH0_9GAMM|nr:STAS/SEC14 domain-containing protein [Thiorhodococcus mannitoliphagus]NEX20024.1 STAS/SEC14 domain-containing protein [Thiorhodococcus mannitoliphagus]
MIEKINIGADNVLGFKLSGKLHDEDYSTFVPQIEAALVATDKISLLAQFEDFQGWDLQAAWDDFKLGMEHYSDFERIALVGEKSWERWMAKLCKPFTRAEVKYFDASEMDAALSWAKGSS